MQISTTKTLRKDLDPERPLKFKTDSFSRGGGVESSWWSTDNAVTRFNTVHRAPPTYNLFQGLCAGMQMRTRVDPEQTLRSLDSIRRHSARYTSAGTE
jgi:hypothetical protein